MSGTPSLTHLRTDFTKSVLVKNEGVNMGTLTIKVILLVSCLSRTVLSKAIHTSDKLDFGDTLHGSSLVKTDKRLPVKVTRTVDSIISPSESVSVSCGPTGCNTTKNNNSIETEVVVHVKTNVNLDKNQERQGVEDVSDIPIVIGYKGSTPDDTPNEEQFRSFPPVSFNENDGSVRRDYASFGPLYMASPAVAGKGYGRHETSRDSPYPSSLNYRPETNRYYGPSFSSTPSTIGYSGPTRTSKVPYTYYDSSTSRPLTINGIPSPISVTISESNRRNFDYNPMGGNNVQLQIPYFSHTYNNHYFGEEPPPHLISYSKTNSINPVEFRNIPKNKWRPSFWNGRTNKYAFNHGESNFMNPYNYNHINPISSYSQPLHARGHGNTGCLCKEQRNDDSNGYAASSVNHHIAVQNKDPGVSIDDKLAPLN